MKKIINIFLSIALMVMMISTLGLNATASETTGIINDGVYTLMNNSSGKYLNVHNGVNADNTNVYQWTQDGSTEQKFKFVYDSSEDAYRIYVMCSSNGTNRVLDIVKSNGAVLSGCNVQIYRPVDYVAQLWVITTVSSGVYKISPKYNTSVALTTCGASNGTSSGTTSTSAGNAYVETCGSTIATKFQWTLTLVQNSTAPSDWSYMFREPKMASKISQKYSSSHYGVDIVHKTYQEINNDYPIYSVGSGVVKVATHSASAGNYVVIELYDGYTVRFLHMKNDPLVSKDQVVTSSTKLGIVGSTGVSTGPHLHFDVNTVGACYGGDGSSHVNYSTTVDPIQFFPTISFTY